MTLLHIPFIEEKLGELTSSYLSSYFDSKIEVKKVNIGLFNQAVLSDITIFSQEGTEIISVDKASCNIEPLPLLHGDIYINAIQLIGMNCKLYRKDKSSPLNIQFIIDRLSPKQRKEKKTVFQLSQIIIRNSSISYDVGSSSLKPEGFLDLNHILLSNFSSVININNLSSDNLDIDIESLEFIELKSGLTLNDLHSRFALNSKLLNLYSPYISINNSEIASNNISIDLSMYNNHPIINMDIQSSHITPSDFKFINPQLKNINESISLKGVFSYNDHLISMEDINLQTSNGQFLFNGDTQIKDASGLNPIIDANIKRLYIAPNYVSQFIPKDIVPHTVLDYINKLGKIEVNGKLHYTKEAIEAQSTISSSIGDVKIDGTFYSPNHLKGNISCKSLSPSMLLPEIPLKNTSLSLFVDLNINDRSYAEGIIKGEISHIEYGQYIIDNIKIDGNLSPDKYQGALSVNDKNLKFLFDGALTGIQTKDYSLKAKLAINKFTPSRFQIPGKYSNHTYDINGTFDISGTNLSDINGMLNIESLGIHGPDYNYILNDLCLTITQKSNNYKHLIISSEPLSGEIEGQFTYNSIKDDLLNSITGLSPLLGIKSESIANKTDYGNLNIIIRNTSLLHKLADVPFEFQEQISISGFFNNPTNSSSYTISTPSAKYTDINLEDFNLSYNNSQESYSVRSDGKLLRENRQVDYSIECTGIGNSLAGKIDFTIDQSNPIHGVLNLNGTLNISNNEIAHITLSPSEINILDQLLKIEATSLDIYNDHIKINDLKAFNDNRSVQINGILSSNPSDSLLVEINGTTIGSIVELANSRLPNIDGYVYGSCNVSNVLSSPRLNANLYIDDLTYKQANLGHAFILANWDNSQEGIRLNCSIIKPEVPNGLTTINGYIYPQGKSIELEAKFQNTDATFLNSMLFRPFKNVEGSINGNAFISGPFNKIDISGLATTDAQLTLRATNVTYSVSPEDPIIITSNSFIFNNIRISDKDSHTNIISGVVTHEKFKNFTYDFDMSLKNLLLYEERNFNNDKFKGVVYGDGELHISGSDGHPLYINADIEPSKGSEFSYDASTPDAITTNTFITYRELTPTDSVLISSGIDPGEYWYHKSNHEEANQQPTNSYRGDIFMNLNIHMNHNCPVKLKMDNVEDGYITTYGTGVLHADYHNKGSFSLNGTYKIQEGKYRLYLQDIIFRDLILQDGSNVVFNGNPFDADIHLICWHTLQSVPLSDLTNAVYTQNNRLRVICILDITGHLGNMNFKFDLNLPNVSDETRQIVKSYISTEEEMNMQLIYLLGFGRFYTNEYARSNGETNTNQAVNSLLSSTLSGQINQMLSNAIGSDSKWNFGTGISTGERGWEDVDFEGTLSGKLLDDRLLINGNFGYRDNSMTNTSSFVGDFDVRWRISSTGNTYLKAYNLTNDRYFTKSTLNTQGIGVTYQRDFESWRDLLKFKSRKKGSVILSAPDSISVDTSETSTLLQFRNDTTNISE